MVQHAAYTITIVPRHPIHEHRELYVQCRLRELYVCRPLHTSTPRQFRHGGDKMSIVAFASTVCKLNIELVYVERASVTLGLGHAMHTRCKYVLNKRTHTLYMYSRSYKLNACSQRAKEIVCDAPLRGGNTLSISSHPENGRRPRATMGGMVRHQVLNN